jgi:hypothetical protein
MNRQETHCRGAGDDSKCLRNQNNKTLANVTSPPTRKHVITVDRQVVVIVISIVQLQIILSGTTIVVVFATLLGAVLSY